MKPSCPCCRESAFRYRALLSVHPYAGEADPARIECPSCGVALRVTAKSRLLGALTAIAVVVGWLLLLAQLPVPLQYWQSFVAAVAGLAIYYFVVWPVIVRFKPWTPFQYWLPRSRLIGYSVYLLLPIAVMALVLWLGIMFGP